MKNRFKKAALAIAAMVMTAALSGCMRMGVGVELRKDGTASYSAMYAMSADYCSEDDFDENEYEVKTFEFDGDKYIGYEIAKDVGSYQELCAELTTLSEDGTAFFDSVKAEKKNSLFTTEYIFEAEMPALMGESDDEYAGLAADMIKVDFTLKIPGKINILQGGTAGEDGTITFKVDPNEKCSFKCQTSEVNIGNILIIAGVALIIIGVAIAAVKKKR